MEFTYPSMRVSLHVSADEVICEGTLVRISAVGSIDSAFAVAVEKIVVGFEWAHPEAGATPALDGAGVTLHVSGSVGERILSSGNLSLTGDEETIQWQAQGDYRGFIYVVLGYGKTQNQSYPENFIHVQPAQVRETLQWTRNMAALETIGLFGGAYFALDIILGRSRSRR